MALWKLHGTVEILYSQTKPHFREGRFQGVAGEALRRDADAAKWVAHLVTEMAFSIQRSISSAMRSTPCRICT